MFPRGSLFGEASGLDIREAFSILTEHVARERSLHGLDALVRAHPDNEALHFICFDLDGQNPLDYPVLTHLPPAPEDPKLILEKA